MKRYHRNGLMGALLASMILTGCGGGAKADQGLMLHLGFNEGSGVTTADLSGTEETAEVNYQFTHAVYMDPQDPEWRTSGVSEGALLFDGCSTYISYAPEDVLISGEAFTVSAYVAPRAFEWDDPHAAENGNAMLTAIAGQYNKDKNQGFLLGYERFGRLCFEVGIGDDWITLWSDANLTRYEWNYVAAVFDGKNGKMSLYLDGAPVAECEIPSGSAIAPAENENLLIGKNTKGQAIAAGTYNMFSGLMDDLRLYSRALTAEELAPAETGEIAFEDIGLSNILTEDIYKTQYHGGPYQHWMNEPHSPVYYNGMYHLFFQQNIVGTYWRNICWGHLVSDNMVSWRPVKEAIVPTEDTVVPDGVWSGNAAYDVNGVPLLFFTAGNDSFSEYGLISNQNIGVAYPADLTDPDLTDWVIYDELAVAQAEGQGRPGEFRDPYLWQQDGIWCMLICSGSAETNGGSALLYTSDVLELKGDGTIDMNWQYRGPVYEMENQSVTYGTSWELPILLPLSNPEKTVTKWAFLISPAPAGLADNKVYYFLGDFDLASGRFTPDPAFDNAPALLDYGDNVFTGPSAMQDPESGEWYLYSIMQDKRSGAEEGAAGWAHCVGLPRRIGLNAEGTDVIIAPAEEINTLEGEVLAEGKDLTLAAANEALASASGDLLHIHAVLKAPAEGKFGLRVKSDGAKEATDFTYDLAYGTISAQTRSRGAAGSVGPQGGPLVLEDGTLSMDIYIDRSLVEGFFNESRAVSIRSYSPFEAQAMEFFADGDLKVLELQVTEMKSIYK